MAPRKPVAVPTTAALPHSHRLPPSSPDVLRTLSKLSRSTLISLALEWLEERNRDFCAPYLANEASNDEPRDQLYPAAHSYEELRETYEELRAGKGGKRQIIDRILEGDWRNGISLYQLAMAETRFLLDHPTSLQWNALRLSKVNASEGANSDIDHLPHFHAETYLRNLQREVAPLTKAHYYITKLKKMPITLLRVQIHDTPYNNIQAPLQHTTSFSKPGSDTTKSIFVAFPTGSPFIYVSLATSVGQTAGSESRTLRSIILDAIPKALSRPQCRYVLKGTSLSARSLEALLSLRGPGRSNSAAGGWSVYAENKLGNGNGALGYIKRPAPSKSQQREQTKAGANNDDTPEIRASFPPRTKRKDSAIPPEVEAQSPAAKRRKLVAEGRFGCSALPDDGKGIERFDVRINDSFPAVPGSSVATSRRQMNAGREDFTRKRPRRKTRPSLLDSTASSDDEAAPAADAAARWTPDVRLSFQGTHVFAGMRQLVESGVVDGEKMLGWMTGEAGVSVGAVKDGRIVAKGN